MNLRFNLMFRSNYHTSAFNEGILVTANKYQLFLQDFLDTFLQSMQEMAQSKGISHGGGYKRISETLDIPWEHCQSRTTNKWRKWGATVALPGTCRPWKFLKGHLASTGHILHESKKKSLVFFTSLAYGVGWLYFLVKKKNPIKACLNHPKPHSKVWQNKRIILGIILKMCLML